MGGQTDLPRANWFGEFEEHVTFHVIDSIRPLSLDSLFMGGTNGERIFVWDDGGAENLVDELKMSWEIVTVRFQIDTLGVSSIS
jgi:cell division control protein 45